MLVIWLYWPDPGERVAVPGQNLTVADGDSFAIGVRKLRLDGIDAPEYRQTCTDPDGRAWECGKASRASLEQFLREPGLACIAGAFDKYGRSIATCSNAHGADIGMVHGLGALVAAVGGFEAATNDVRQLVQRMLGGRHG